jgi:site-specific recombinase XerD
MSAQRKTYHSDRDTQNILQLREVLKDFPPFAKQYFLAQESSKESRTRLSYAYDIRTFFRYLQENNPVLRDKDIHTWDVSILDELSAADIDEYKSFLSVYSVDESLVGTPKENSFTNGEFGLKRKMSALRSFYAFYFKREMIRTNPTLLVDMPKLHEHNIVRMDEGETAALLDYIEHGCDSLTGQKKVYYEKTRTRDLAIVTLLLGTGIRVSECVGLDIEDVDFRNNGIRIIRKGGSESIVYFGDEVEQALSAWIEERKAITPLAGHEHALFYSSQKRRMGVQAVENMVKKYSRMVTTTKKITPHKLRSTYGTSLYRETGDIYLVADVLGHKDVNTTKKHYAAMDDDRRRRAAGAVRLREEG